VALEQREHGWKRCTKFVFKFLLEALEGFDKIPKVERRPLVLPKHHIQKRAAALITPSLQGGKRVCHVWCTGNEVTNLFQGWGHEAPVQVAVGNRAATHERG
jgi:hypothetical protein